MELRCSERWSGIDVTFSRPEGPGVIIAVNETMSDADFIVELGTV